MDAIESQNGRKSISLAEVLDSNPNCVPPPLSIGDKIIWLSDNGTEEGIVKWLGILPDVGKDWMAGVQFENAVGSGTGLYNNQQLFIAPMNHASLVPVIGLIKSEDFLGDQNGAPKKPLRKKKIDLDDPAIQHALQANSYLINKENSTLPTKTNSAKKGNEKKQSKSQRNYELLPELLAQQCDTKRDKKSIDSVDVSPVDDFEIGSMVEVVIESQPYYDVIRWLGYVPGYDHPIAGLELEEEIPNGGDGMFANKRYFTCSSRRSIFRPIVSLKKDSRFSQTDDIDNQPDDYLNHNSSSSNCPSIPKNGNNNNMDDDQQKADENFSEVDGAFGAIDCPRIEGNISPMSGGSVIKNLCGKNRGIQGHHNSCYMDATLFAMFTCSSTFESLLQRPPSRNDIPEYSEVQLVLKEEIVNPLRQNYYVRADRVMKLRKLLEKLSSVRGLTSEEKDPEEFINLLLGEIFKTDPYLKLSSGLESYLYQLFVEKDERLVLPTVQQLFDQSFLTSNIKLNEIPNCLILQLPRYGKQFKMYNRVIPSLYLDITDVLDNSPRQCTICGELALLECKECFSNFGEGLQSTAFCLNCSASSHSPNSSRFNHKMTKLNVPIEFIEFTKKRYLSGQNSNKSKFSMPIERMYIYMDLFAILCIETSHYVCFVKCGSGLDAPWCFFDSMADRKGEQNGYNIPEVTSFPDLKWWLSDEGKNYLLTIKDDKLLPEMPRRLLCDAYMCLYQSSDVNLYK